MTIEKVRTGGQTPKDMINKLEQARLESEKKAAEQKQKRAEELEVLTKEATDMATRNYRLDQATRADMSRRRQWTAQGKDDEGHTQAESSEHERTALGNFNELSRVIYEQESVDHNLEQKIRETELILESHPDVKPVLVEARTELEKLRQAIADKKAELEKGRQSAGIKVRDIKKKWEQFGGEQKKAAENPDAFAAEQVLKAQELVGTPLEIKPEELKSAVTEEARRRHKEKVEKQESEMETAEMKVINEVTEELKTAETEMMNDLNAQAAFLNGETPEGKEFLTQFEQKKRRFETLQNKTFWFNEAQREKARDAELTRLADEIKGGEVQVASKLESVNEKLAGLLRKAWHGQEREVSELPAYSHPYEDTGKKMKNVIMGAERPHGWGGEPSSPMYWNNQERRERVKVARETLRKRGHELQNKIMPRFEEVQKLLREKIKLLNNIRWYASK